MNHDVIDARSMELHGLIAKKLRNDPSLLSIPIEYVRRWMSRSPDNSTESCLEWEEILKRPLEEVLRILTLDTEDGRRLRQSSPFSGILTPEERKEIFQKYEIYRVSSSLNS